MVRFQQLQVIQILYLRNAELHKFKKLTPGRDDSDDCP